MVHWENFKPSIASNEVMEEVKAPNLGGGSTWLPIRAQTSNKLKFRPAKRQRQPVNLVTIVTTPSPSQVIAGAPGWISKR